MISHVYVEPTGRIYILDAQYDFIPCKFLEKNAYFRLFREDISENIYWRVRIFVEFHIHWLNWILKPFNP